MLFFSKLHLICPLLFYVILKFGEWHIVNTHFMLISCWLPKWCFIEHKILFTFIVNCMRKHRTLFWCVNNSFWYEWLKLQIRGSQAQNEIFLNLFANFSLSLIACLFLICNAFSVSWPYILWEQPCFSKCKTIVWFITT